MFQAISKSLVIYGANPNDIARLLCCTRYETNTVEHREGDTSVLKLDVLYTEPTCQRRYL